MLYVSIRNVRVCICSFFSVPYLGDDSGPSIHYSFMFYEDTYEVGEMEGFEP